MFYCVRKGTILLGKQFHLEIKKTKTAETEMQANIACVAPRRL